ncbi:MAG TPA: phosphate signaling complex protein PhoU [Longimicrobiales bacterium]|nr:phosphate signaling complex protein PhoU [Longimicrobiales bacterium]
MTERRRHFRDELDALQERLLEMAGLVEQVIGEATEAVLARDPTVAEKVAHEDHRIDELEVEIDERVVELLALQQPMATDLRRIVMTNKISNDLERMGDHAVNIAKAARRLAETHPLPELRELREMATVVRGMLADALAAYVTRSSGTARVVLATDDRVDDLRGSLFRILVTHMLEDPKRIGGALELLLVSQNLERIGDLATNIAEDVVYLVEGRTIKHGAESAGPRDARA